MKDFFNKTEETTLPTEENKTTEGTIEISSLSKEDQDKLLEITRKRVKDTNMRDALGFDSKNTRDQNKID
jgi:hypothetical protein